MPTGRFSKDRLNVGINTYNSYIQIHISALILEKWNIYSIWEKKNRLLWHIKPSSDKLVFLKLPSHCFSGVFKSSQCTGHGSSGLKTVGQGPESLVSAIVSMSTCVCITLYAISVGKGTASACSSLLRVVQTAHLPLPSCTRWAHTCSVAHLFSNSHTCSSQGFPPTAWIKPLKAGMGRQQCVDWLGSRGHSSWKAVHQALLCLLGTHALWCTLSQHVAHVESSPVSTPNPLCDSVVRRVTSLNFCLCSKNGSKCSY